MTLKDKKIAIYIFGAINALLTPLAFMIMWNWFITKIGAPNINYWLSFGIVLTADFMIMKPSQMSEKMLNDDTDQRYKMNILSSATIVTTTIFALIIHLFVG